MGASGDHGPHPAHTHLNLLGWVALSIMDGVYAPPGAPRGGTLAWVNFGLSTLGAISSGRKPAA